jgi:hypothetical protein
MHLGTWGTGEMNPEIVMGEFPGILHHSDGTASTPRGTS